MSESQPSNIVSVTPGDLSYWKNAVKRMAELTRANKLRWETVDAANAKASSSRKIHSAYDAVYDGKTARFLETEPNSRAMTALEKMFQETDGLLRPYDTRPQQDAPQKEYRLLLVDTNGVALFVFPNGLPLIELLKAIKTQIADVESFVNALFAAA